MAMLLMILGDP